MNNKGMLAFACVVAVAVATPSFARDDRLKFPVEAALTKGQNYKEKVDPNIRLYFGEQRTPKVAKKIGEWTSNKKTNAANKSDQEACDLAFISAVVSLQDRAKREGGNAVVNITSVYKNEPFTSPKEYMCGAGTFMSGVALRGTVVTLDKK
jgi:uncharacterized protein YbjQ (UPF0145 family)